MNTLTTAATLAAINATLDSPITRQLFEQSIRPVMEARGDAKRVGSTWLFDGDSLPMWTRYLAWREDRIDRGLLPQTSIYSAAAAEALAKGEVE